MKSHELMQLLIPDGKVQAVAEALGLSSSLIYMERRGPGESHTRNVIDRLDVITELAVEHTPLAVRLLAERFANKYEMCRPLPIPTEAELLTSLGEVSRLCGEAVYALCGRHSLTRCTVEVAQAKAALEQALALVTALEEQS